MSNKATGADPAVHPVEAMLSRANDEAISGRVMEGLLAPVRRLMNEAASLEELRDGLLDLYPDMDSRAFASLMERALTAADLAGRAGVER